jgi:N-acetylglucosaminyldiphosphoundecaprenol N-acetyl-beta-D-mannosaminyltransferase
MIKTYKIMATNQKPVEAKINLKDRNKDIIMGIKISSTPQERVLNLIREKCNEKDFVKPFFVITAYSEFFLKAEKEKEFNRILHNADLVLPDGVSVVAALDYLKMRSGSKGRDFLSGLRVGTRILAGEYNDQKTEGVKLTREILREAGQKGWKVFLLGGKGGVAGRLAMMMKKDFREIQTGWEEGYTNIKIQITDSQINNQILNKINEFKPDVLLVAYGMPWQEKWIDMNLKKLQTKVVMGVGSSFDEIMREGPWRKPVPGWVETMGLKWLWRAFVDRRHWKRAWNAFPVFAWKVYRSK